MSPVPDSGWRLPIASADEGHLWREPEHRGPFEVDWKGHYSMIEVFAIATAFLLAGFLGGHLLWR